MNTSENQVSKEPVKAKLLRMKIDSKRHIEAYKIDPKEGIENENSITFIIKRLMPIQDKWMIENAGGMISEKTRFGYFVWKNQIKISKESLQFMAYATEKLL